MGLPRGFLEPAKPSASASTRAEPPRPSETERRIDGMSGNKKRKLEEEAAAAASDGEVHAIDDVEVHVVTFSAPEFHLDASESAMLLKSALAPTHSKSAFSAAATDIRGRAWFASASAAARAATLDGTCSKADPDGCAWQATTTRTTVRDAALLLMGRGTHEAELFEEPFTSAATTLKSRDARFDEEESVGEGPLWSFCLPSLEVDGDDEVVQFRAMDEAAAVASAAWRCLKRTVQHAIPKSVSNQDAREARRACLFAHNAATPVALSKVWDAAAPAKFDAKAEKWTLPACDGGEFGDARLPKSPPTILAKDSGTRCAWTSRKTVKRSRFLALHRRRVAERSLRAEEVLETVVDAGGSRWTLSLDARRPEHKQNERWEDDQRREDDDSSDVGVYARCDFAGSGGARPFGACCEARFAFCVVENLGSNCGGCAGSRAASWLFRGRELYEDQSVPPLPARGFARLVLGLGDDLDEDVEAEQPDDVRCATERLWFRHNAVEDRNSWANNREDEDESDDPELVVVASVLVSRRAKGADTWRLVRRCCAERASGYAPATLRPQNLWAFLCRAIRWGDVECTKAIARQIQAERGGDAIRGILRCVGCEDDAALGGLGLLGSVGAENQNYSALHWLGNCDDGNFDRGNAPPTFAPRYGAIVAWLRSVCGAEAFEAEVNGAGGGSRGRTSTPLAFVAGSCGEKTRRSSRLAVAALLRAGADPRRPASRNEPAREASVSTERGTFVVARALYADNKEIAEELLGALFGTSAKPLVLDGDDAAAYGVVADAVDVLLSKADEVVVASGLECLLAHSPDSREATLAALRKRHADAVGRDADRSPVHELVACALRMETNPSAKQRKRKDLKETIDCTLALAARLVKEERLGLRHARGGERVRLYLEAFTRRQERAQREQEKSKVLASKVSQAPQVYDDADLLDGWSSEDKDQPKKAKKKKKKKKKKVEVEAPPPVEIVKPRTPSPSPSPSEDSSDSSNDDAPQQILRKPETEEERAAAKLSTLVDLYVKSPDRALSAEEADELGQLRDKTCGSEGAARDRQAAKRLLRKRFEAPKKAAEKAAAAARKTTTRPSTPPGVARRRNAPPTPPTPPSGGRRQPAARRAPSHSPARPLQTTSPARLPPAPRRPAVASPGGRARPAPASPRRPAPVGPPLLDDDGRPSARERRRERQAARQAAAGAQAAGAQQARAPPGPRPGHARAAAPARAAPPGVGGRTAQTGLNSARDAVFQPPDLGGGRRATNGDTASVLWSWGGGGLGGLGAPAGGGAPGLGGLGSAPGGGAPGLGGIGAPGLGGLRAPGAGLNHGLNQPAKPPDASNNSGGLFGGRGLW